MMGGSGSAIRPVTGAGMTPVQSHKTQAQTQSHNQGQTKPAKSATPSAAGPMGPQHPVRPIKYGASMHAPPEAAGWGWGASTSQQLQQRIPPTTNAIPPNPMEKKQDVATIPINKLVEPTDTLRQLQRERISMQASFAEKTKQTLAQQRQALLQQYQLAQDEIESKFQMEKQQAEKRFSEELANLQRRKEDQSKTKKTTLEQQLKLLETEGQQLVEWSNTNGASALPVSVADVNYGITAVSPLPSSNRQVSQLPTPTVSQVPVAPPPSPPYYAIPALPSPSPPTLSKDDPNKFVRDEFFEKWICSALQKTPAQVTSLTIQQLVGELIQYNISAPPPNNTFWQMVSPSFLAGYGQYLAPWRQAA